MVQHLKKRIILHLQITKLSDGVTGNTSDSGSEESRFEPWSDNKIKNPAKAGFFCFIQEPNWIIPKNEVAEVRVSFLHPNEA